jgi:hypothetical protein
MVTFAEIIDNDKLFFERFIIIEDRNKNDIVFNLNPAQEIMHNNLTGRDLRIKASQLGSTTFDLMRGYKKVITEHNTTAVVVAHEEFLTQRLLARVRHVHDRLPIPDSKKPKLSHNSSYEMTFPSLRSTFYIGTAGAKVFGRGEPIHFFLGSEVAFWPDPHKILDPTEQRVPLDGEMILESTPNGEGTEREPNVFYQMVQEALNGDGIWNLLQLPWWLEIEYQLPIGSKYALKGDEDKITKYTEDEVNLIIRAGWNDDEADRRIRWRRRKVSSIKSAFWQEFFEDIVSCFLAVAEPFYASDDTDRLNSMCYDAEYSYGNAQIWNPPAAPEDNPVYIVSVDPGQGKATRSVAQVWRMDLDNFNTIRHEATLSGLYDNLAFAPQVIELATYYHYAKIVPESNGHGQGFCARITEYDNLYYRTDIVSGISSRQIGWMTTGSTRIGSTGTKMYGISELQALLPIIETHDINLVRELKQVRYSGGNIVFLGNDDNHDAAMIMAATRSSHTGNSNRGLIGHAGHNFG